MVKKLITMGIFLVFPIFSYAQSCTLKTVTPKIILNVKPLIIDQGKTVAYLSVISKDREHSPIGIYTAEKNIRILPSFTVKTNRLTSNSCAELNDIKITLDVTPIVYLSIESQQYPCTKNRVYAHEMKHYKIEIDALNNLAPYLTGIAIEKYNTVLNASTDKEISKNIDKINKEVIELAFEFLKKQTMPYHNQLDTIENYKKESDYCSNIENIYLSRLIKVGTVEALNK